MKIRPLFLVLAIIINILMISTFTYAWFANNQTYMLNTGGMSKEQYFASGDGTELDPYIMLNIYIVYQNLMKWD
jgi:hypothetical protein